MPKKPCAVTLLPNDETIISGDKFGDVFSLPLLPTPEQLEAPTSTPIPEATKSFAPAATTTTVHSKANRKALEAQLKQAEEKKHTTKTKEPLAFTHELVLGHVSLLTDLLVATVGDEQGLEKPKVYILTSDRDEHIRISRGPPQSFIIEGFCQGHEEFINKMCLPQPSLLVSGGGDSDLYVWHWLEYKLLKKINLLEVVLRERKALKQQESIEQAKLETSIAISGLWTCPGPELGKVRHLGILVFRNSYIDFV
jgi:tRNA (guanine-N(7)-)-methyltransferase subunit TRM82